MDSGNLFSDLISLELAEKLNLKFEPVNKEVGTASQTGAMQIIGKVHQLKMFIEGIKKAVIIQPYIVKGLAHQLNLGQHFLRTNQADMTFRPAGTQLKLGNDCTTLITRASALTKPTVDARLLPVIEEWKKQGENPMNVKDVLDMRVNQIVVNAPSNKQAVIWNETRRTCYHAKKIMLPKASTTWIKIQTGRQDKELCTENFIVVPKRDNSYLNNNELHVHPGAYRMQNNEMKILITNFSNKDVRLPLSCKLGHVHEAVPQQIDADVNTLDHRPLEELTEAEVNEWRKFIIEGLKLDENEIIKQKPELKEEVIQLFLENRAAIAVTDHDYGKTNLVKFQIELKPGATPVHMKLRPLNPFQEKDLNRQLDEWLNGGIIEESISPWGAALVPCKKKNSDKLRWALDYRQLNLQTIKDNYPLPNIESNLHKLSGSSCFSCVDALGAYHNVVVDQQSRDLTAFLTPRGQYHFIRMPFGVSNAPSTYSRLVQKALGMLPPGFALGYLDDIIIHSQSPEEHVDHLRQVIALHARCGMKLRLSKCCIMQSQVQYLGHVVNKNGIGMIPSYVDKILSWPLPRDGKSLKLFLRFTSYYRSFIKEYAHLTCEMNKLKNEKGEIQYPPEVAAKFETLKACFSAAPVRGFPQYDNPNPFILDCDWSSTNMAAVLSQVQNGKEVFLGCAAKKNNRAESNYSAHRGELAAVILGTKKFEHILRARPFKIRTDSSCVQNLATMKECRGVFARMQAYLAGFDYEIEHRAGTKHVNADALSRRAGLPDEADELLDLGEGLDDIDDIYNVDEMQIMEVTPEHLRQQVQGDVVLRRIINYVEQGHKPDKEERKTLTRDGITYVNIFECLQADEGILYFQPPTVNGEEVPKRVCLPPTLWHAAFQSCHTLQSAGHFGINNTHRKMKQLFYFPHMYSYVQAKVTNCVQCITKRNTLGAPKHQLHREQLSYFNQRVYTDTVGPLTGIVYQGKLVRHFLTVLDGWSRWLVAEPIASTSTEDIAEAFINRWVFVHGCPEVLHSDRGSGFTSKLFNEIMKRLGVCKTVTPPYTPSSNRIERSHLTIGRLIRADRSVEAREWPQKLQSAVFAYNTCNNRAIGCSPFEVVFGQKAILPVDFLFPFQKPEGRSTSNLVENLRMKYQDAYEKVAKHEQKYIAIDAARYQGRSPINFKEGDVVYYFLGRTKRGLSKKLQSRWIGPFKIKKRVSESLVVIFPEGRWAKNPKEIATIVSRLRKVDPQVLHADLYPSRRHQVDMPAILDDLVDMGEDIAYSDDFETEDDTPHREPTSLLPWITSTGERNPTVTEEPPSMSNEETQVAPQQTDERQMDTNKNYRPRTEQNHHRTEPSEQNDTVKQETPEGSTAGDLDTTAASQYSTATSASSNTNFEADPLQETLEQPLQREEVQDLLIERRQSSRHVPRVQYRDNRSYKKTDKTALTRYATRGKRK